MYLPAIQSDFGRLIARNAKTRHGLWSSRNRLRVACAVAHDVALVFFCIISISSCDRAVIQTTDSNTSPRISLPENEAPQNTNPRRGSPDSIDEIHEPRVIIDSNDTVLAVYNVNLDLDASEEQVLLLVHEAEIEAPIRVAVISFDTLISGYAVAYEGATGSINTQSTALTFVDLVGDHGLEIVARGMNEGNQTIDVLRKSASPSGFGLYYESILSLAVDGTIEIEPVQRSEAYREGFTNGESFTIKTLTPPELSQNILDLMLTRYFWKFADRRYIRGVEERISGAAIEQSQLEELFRSNARSFEEFLGGVWFLEFPAGHKEIYLMFEPGRRRFTYYANDIQEVYVWNASYKTLVNQAEITGTNDLIPYIRKNLYVRIDSLDSIRLLGSDPWIGTYRRMSASTNFESESTVIEATHLSGLYLSDIGEKLYFDGSDFEIEWSGNFYEGVFTLYRIDTPVLELRVREKTGVFGDNLRFELIFSDAVRNDRLYRTIYLKPGVVGIYGFEANGEEAIRYEQIVRQDE